MPAPLIPLLLACRIEQGIAPPPGGDSGEAPVDPYTHDGDMDGTVDAEDCAPEDQEVHPGAGERCNDRDDDCDGRVDEGFDEDDDGWNDGAECWALPGPWDCDDGDPAVHPDADEVCDGIDNNCDGAVDDADRDGDGADSCADCDDADPFVAPGAAEACDGLDNDCDGGVDELWDADGDGWSPCAGDCDDEDAAVHPEAGDPCDGLDNNCDGAVDPAFDLDADGVTTCAGDCDDAEPTVYPGSPERCDGLDNDCDAATPERGDLDADGWSVCDGDCDDADPDATPAGLEACDGHDNDCSGFVDDLPECWGCADAGGYTLCTGAASWASAEGTCEALGGTLVIVEDRAENDALTTLTTTPTWVGATDAALEGDWLTPLGDYLPYDRWQAGEPDGEGADCAVLNDGGRLGWWADADCAEAHRFLCEGP